MNFNIEIHAVTPRCNLIKESLESASQRFQCLRKETTIHFPGYKIVDFMKNYTTAI